MFGWGFLTATILWLIIMEWKAKVITGFFKRVWRGFKDWVKRIIQDW